MSSNYEPPIRITLPIPSDIPRARGINSTSSYGGNIRLRCSDAEYELVKEEAAAIGVSLAAFCRWLSVKAAQTLKKHREQQLTTDEAKDGTVSFR